MKKIFYLFLLISLFAWSQDTEYRFSLANSMKRHFSTSSSPTFAGLTLTDWFSHGTTYDGHISFGYQAGKNANGVYRIFMGTYAGYDSTMTFSTGIGENNLRLSSGVGGTSVGPYAGYAYAGIEPSLFGWDSGNGARGNGNSLFGARNGYTSIYPPPSGINYFTSLSADYCSALGYSNLFGCTRWGAGAWGTFNTAANLDVGTWAATGSGVGLIDASNRRYRISAVIDGIESELSEHAPVSTGSALSAQIDHTNIPLYIGPGTCTSRKIYRRKSADGYYYYVGTIADNTTTTYVDTQANNTYGAVAAGPANTWAIGHKAFTVGPNEMAVGSSDYPITTLYWGSKYHKTSGNAGLPFYQYSMGGNGTNQAGGDHNLGGGAGTGTAEGGKTAIWVTKPGSTGTTANPYTKMFEVTATGIEPTAESRSLKVWENFEDFVTAAINPGIYSRSVSTGATSGITATWMVPGRIGIYRVGTAAATNGWGAISANLTGFQFTGGTFTMEGDINVNSLSTGTDTFALYFGFGDTVGVASDQANGVYFRYSDTGSTPNWMLTTAKAGVRTSISSGVAVAADTWYRLRIVVAANGASAIYYINEANVGTLNTNMPTAVCGPLYFIEKSAGTTPVIAYTDWIWIHIDLTASR